jgi:hypothetical protein
MSPYKLARKILPASLQAKLGNRHKVKRLTLDKLLFRFTRHRKEERLYHIVSATPNMPAYALEENPHIPQALAQSYRVNYRKENVEQVVKVADEVYIEPITGWPMGKRNELYLSLHPSGISPYMPVPAYRSIVSKKPLVTFDKIISLRDVNEAGYSHFYTDILAKLVLVRRLIGSLKPYTLIISKTLSNTAYGRFLLENTPIFKEAGGVFLQSDEYVTAKEVIFSSVFVNPSNNTTIIKEVIAQTREAHPCTNTDERKIYLTRGKHRRRTIRNNDEIESIMRGYDFEILDTDNLTLQQQIETFKNCRYLVGIHGAGLANMIHRYPHSLSLFEIPEPLHPILGANPLYHNITVALGFDYGATVGEDTHPENQSFYVPPKRFLADFDAFWKAQQKK